MGDKSRTPASFYTIENYVELGSQRAIFSVKKS